MPGKGATYDSEMRETAFNLIDAAGSSSLPPSPRPFVFVSAAEAGWEDNKMGRDIENFMREKNFFLPRYLDAKREVEKRMKSDCENLNLKPIIARPSFMWDPTKFDILPLLPLWSAGYKLNVGNGAFNPPLRVEVAGSSIVELIDEGTKEGVVTSKEMDDMAPDAVKRRPDEIDTLTSGLASVSRLPYGITVAPELSGSSASPPVRPHSSKIQIYQFEGCPFCRRVREACTHLDIEYTVVPCGRDSRHRKQVENAASLMGRKATYPFMEDLEMGVQLFESEDIIKHLIDNYGGGAGLPEPKDYFLTSTLTTGWIPSLLRGGRGGKVAPSVVGSPPAQKTLVLYDYDGNQFSRLVREALVELDLVHVIKSVGNGSGRRVELEEVSGSTR